MTRFTPDIITSPTNPLIKHLRGLDRKKARSDSGLFLAEGTRLVAQGLQNDWKADVLLVNSNMIERPYIQDLMEHAAAKETKIAQVPKKLIAKVSRKDNPQAVVAAFQQKQRSLSDLQVSEEGIWIGLFEIRDPGNLGTILRTADCAHVRGVILLGTCCDPYSVEAVRASMGSIFDIPFVECSFEAFNAWRLSNQMAMVAASVNGTERHDQSIYGKQPVILMGNEQAGLPAEVEAACDTLALIPMRGGADSLNLAQATAIMTYEAWRQKGFE